MTLVISFVPRAPSPQRTSQRPSQKLNAPALTAATLARSRARRFHDLARLRFGEEVCEEADWAGFRRCDVRLPRQEGRENVLQPLLDTP